MEPIWAETDEELSESLAMECSSVKEIVARGLISMGWKYDLAEYVLYKEVDGKTEGDLDLYKEVGGKKEGDLDRISVGVIECVRDIKDGIRLANILNSMGWQREASVLTSAYNKLVRFLKSQQSRE